MRRLPIFVPEASRVPPYWCPNPKNAPSCRQIETARVARLVVLQSVGALCTSRSGGIPMQFYVRAYDEDERVGPLSLSAAIAIVRATALAQRAKGSRVWANGQGKLFVKEEGCALSALWVTDEHDRVMNIDVISEFGTLGQQISRGIKGRIDSLVNTKRH